MALMLLSAWESFDCIECEKDENGDHRDDCELDKLVKKHFKPESEDE